jgi:hypothetical protein
MLPSSSHLPPKLKNSLPFKENIDIEQLLDWAYRVQCVDRRAARQWGATRPAAYPSSTPFSAFEALGTRVDTSGFTAHDLANIKVDDALLIHDTVLRLSEMWIEWRGRDEVVVWDHAAAKSAGKVIEQTAQGFVMYDVYHWGGSVVPPPVPLEQAGTSVLVIIHAKGGVRPDVHEEWVEPRGVVPSDLSKRDRRNRMRRSADGVSAHEVMHARAVYTVWHAALSLLAVELEGRLQRFAVTGLMADLQPWTSVRRKVWKQA